MRRAVHPRRPRGRARSRAHRRARLWPRTTVVATTSALLAVTACAPDGPTVDDDPNGGAAAAGYVACADLDGPGYSPPPEEQPDVDPGTTTGDLIDDVPVGDDDVPPPGATTSASNPLGEAPAWAEREAADDFGGVWFDNDHGARVIAFTDDVAAYADEVRERFGEDWWVVEVAYSERELRAVTDAAMSAETVEPSDGSGLRAAPGSILSGGPDIVANRVTVQVVGGDDEALAELYADIGHDAVCLDVIDPPDDPDPDGPVRTLAKVDGHRGGLAFDGFAHLEVADDAETAARAIADNVPDDLPEGGDELAEPGVHADLDAVDWDTEVVAVWTSGQSGSCPAVVADVVSDGGQVRVETTSPIVGACTDDYNPYTVVLAVDRDRLPAVDELPVPLDAPGIDDSQAVPYPDG